MSLVAKSEEQKLNEVYVLRAAKELAKSHICDVVESTVLSLRSVRYSLNPGHDGRMVTRGAKAMGEAIAKGVMQTLLDSAPINYRRMVNEANEDDDVINEDSVQDALRNYVSDIMAQWKGE